MPVNVSSEIGRLRTVLVHTPGPELLAVTPSTREDYLYDDIIDVETAQREHRRFVAILERFAQVLSVRQLLADAVASTEVRELLIREPTDLVFSGPLARELQGVPGDAVGGMVVEAGEGPPGPLAKTLNGTGDTLPPLPDPFFTRDVARGIGEHVIICSMRYGIRWTEELIMKALFLYHPSLMNSGIIYDGSIERRLNYTIEGGDVHPDRKSAV